jgi:orotidine-5'-phosphate decarboxylase
VAAVIGNGLDKGGRGLIINVSRQVLYASREKDFAVAAARAARQLRDEIARERERALAES